MVHLSMLIITLSLYQDQADYLNLVEAFKK